jgi:hypothetical protein
MRKRWFISDCFYFVRQKTENEAGGILRSILALEDTRGTDFDEFADFCDVGFYTGFLFELLL